MEMSILMARFLGPFFVVVGIGVLLNLKRYQKLIMDFFENTAVLYLGGVMAFAIGIVIVLFHNVWTLNWGIIITILGWVSLVKGIVLIVCPAVMVKMANVCHKNAAVLAIDAVVFLVIGAFLSLMGYFV